MLLNCCIQYVSKSGKLSCGHRKRSVFIPILKKGNAKECSNYHTAALKLHASKVMLKILQVSLQQYINWKLPDAQAGFRKGRRTRNQIVNICCIIGKAREFQKNIYFCCIDYAKAFVWITTNRGKFLKRWKYQTTLPVSWETCMQIKKQQLEPDMEKWTGSKLRKEYNKAVYCHPAYLTSMQSTSCKMLDLMNHKLESRLLGGISTTSDRQIIPF